MHYRAVLFDWMLTLADYPSKAAQIRTAAAEIGRSISDREVAGLVDGLTLAGSDPEVQAADARMDCSVEDHHFGEHLVFSKAGIDPELADAIYALLGRPDQHPLYPEVPGVLEALSTRGVRVVVLSDIHVDLRAHAREFGIGAWIDDWVLSYEHGVQKPDPRMFELALAAAGVDAADALMVGDRASHDGAASLLGIDSFVLPARGRDAAVPSDRLEGVIRLVG